MTKFTRKCPQCKGEFTNGTTSADGKRICPSCGKVLSEPSLELRVVTKIKLTEEAVDAIMCAALEDGITYWCSEARVGGAYLGEYAHEQIARGGTLKLYDEDDEKWYSLTLGKLLKGLSMYIAAGYASDIINEGEVDPCAVDSEIADGIVQYAVLGDLIYG